MRYHDIVEQSGDLSNSGHEPNGNELENLKTYYIILRPEKDAFKKCGNLINTLFGLNLLGQTKITSHINHIPVIEELDPTKCYIYWDIYLATAASKEKIHETFIFVNEYCQIEIHEVASWNLFETTINS